MLTTAEIAARPHPAYPREIRGHGLALRPWDRDLTRQMGNWTEHGYPYAAFDLPHLQDPLRADSVLKWALEDGRHRHFVAVEDDVAVGRLSVNLEDDIGLYLWAVHVPPEHEGRGVCKRMMATLMAWFEDICPQLPFTLTTNAFATRAHHAYFALGFTIADVRWVHDQAVAGGLWNATPGQRRVVQGHMRFYNGKWETRSYLMIRQPGSAMTVPPRRR